MKKINRTGRVFGRLTVIKEADTVVKNGRRKVYWLCRCDCGNEIRLVADSMGVTKSCGCIQKEKIASLNYKHGEANKTKENKTWYGIKDRCYNENATKYPDYGGRGIKVCDRWLNSYEDFLTDMGRAPSENHSIDRIDVNGDYEPANCRWATDLQQANNMRTNVLLTHNGTTLTMAQWARKLGYKYKYFHACIRYKGQTLSSLYNNSLINTTE